MTNDMYCKDDLLTDSVFLREVGVVSILYPRAQFADFPAHGRKGPVADEILGLSSALTEKNMRKKGCA